MKKNIGARVKYIREDTERDIATGYYPPIGTLGTIVDDEDPCYQVQWDIPLKYHDHTWWCEHTDVEIIKEGNLSSITNYNNVSQGT